MNKFLNKFSTLLSLGINYNERIYGLDYLRTVAIMLVLISHSRVFLEGLLGSKVIEYFTIGGFLGVELFFVLSGFLIGTILLKINAKGDGMSLKNLSNFWLRRWFRTLPNYYLILIVNFVLIFLFRDKFLLEDEHYWLYFIFAQNLVTNHPVFFGEAWSLAVEEWFYLTLPFFIFLLTLITKKRMNRKSIILYSILMLLALVTSYRFFIAFSSEIDWDKDIRKIVPVRLDAILYGVIVAYIKFYHENFWNKFTNKASILGVLFLIFIVFFFYFGIAQKEDTSFFANTIYTTIVNFGLALFLFPFAKMNKKNYNVFDKVVTILSVVSYSMYLIHRLCVIGLMKFFELSNLMESILAFVLFWLSTIIISILLFKYFEKPTTKLRDRYGKGKKSITVVS